ncbi:MAG: DUF362 domain-containing protein [Acidimicrobiales bacterium]
MANGKSTHNPDQTPSPSEEELDRAQSVEWSELTRAAPAGHLDVAAALRPDLVRLVDERVKPGSRVGVAVGSRGISRVAEVVHEVVGALRDRGAEPVIIPAMGSHGGATPAGQTKALRELGVDEAAAGAPVEASMETEEVGRLKGGQAVYVSKTALGCDALVPVNRVKPHTDFRAPVESGLTKMLAIGLGKQRGASSIHSAGFDAFGEVLPEAVQMVLGALRVPFGVALVEDAWHRLHRVEVVPGEEILERDKVLLAEALDNFGRLPFGQFDVLVVRDMGKTISGAGMDPNVTGRFTGMALAGAPSIRRLAVLDLVESSGGNAIGLGLADIVTERLRSKVDWAATYANALASKALHAAKLPFVATTDREALAFAVASLTGKARQRQLRLAAMTSTLDVNHIAVSGPLLEEATAAGYSVTASGCRGEFGRDGTLVRIGGLEFFPAP